MPFGSAPIGDIVVSAGAVGDVRAAGVELVRHLHGQLAGIGYG
jgi:hypothetical protein